MKKKSQNKEGWTLYNGLYEVFWEDGEAAAVAIEGVIFTATRRGKKSPTSYPEVKR